MSDEPFFDIDEATRRGDARLHAAVAKMSAITGKAVSSPADVIAHVVADRLLLEDLAYVREHDAAAFEQLQFALRAAMVKQRDIDAMKRALPGIRDAKHQSPCEIPPLSAEDAPGLPGWQLPGTWSFRNADEEIGLFKVRMGKDGPSFLLVARCPIAVIARAKDISTGGERIALAWKTDAVWRTRVVPRETIADARRLVEHSAFGFPVDSTISKDLVPFLSEVEHLNRHILPCELLSSQLGWLRVDGRWAFLFGTKLLAAAASVAVKFQGDDVGDDKIAASFGSSSGTLEGWLAAVVVVAQYWRIQVAIYAAFASSMLEILKAEGFVVDIAGETSRGKTSALEVAASTSGNPDQRADDTVVDTWDSTRVGLERSAAVRNDLTSFCDDSKRAKNHSTVAGCVYDYVSGKQRIRGSKSGLAQAKTYRGVMISTGEAPLSSFSEDGGTRARIIPLWGSPFSAADSKTAAVIRELVEGVRTNYGHAAPRFVQHVLDNQHRWPEYRARFLELRKLYADDAKGDVIAGRRGGHVAVLRITAEIAQNVFGLQWNIESTFTELWASVKSDGADTDMPLKALHQVLDWAASNPEKFVTPENGKGHEPHGGWLGRRDAGDAPPMFFTTQLKRFLTEQKHTPDAILGAWRDRKWLDIDGGRFTKKVRAGGMNTGMFVLNAKALEAAAADTPGEDADVPF